MSVRNMFVLILTLTAIVAAAPARGAAGAAGDAGDVGRPSAATHSPEAPTYSVYLPSRFTPETKWPVLICFDPAKRAMVPIELFRDAAERHGFIIASSGSYDSADSVSRSLDVMASLWNDVISRYPIDFERVYAAGFSGGGRICWLLDKMARDVDFAGIIEVGAGLPRRNFLEDWTPRLTYRGLIGLTDFNYYEMRWLDGELDRRSIPHRLTSFDGGHEWPPTWVCAEALDEMQIAAMRSGRIAVDSSFVEEVYARERDRLAREEAAERLPEALERATATIDAFRGLRGVEEIQETRDRLLRSKKTATLQRSREARELDATARIDRALAAMEKVLEARTFIERPTLGQLIQETDLLALRGMRDGSDPEKRLAAERILGAIYVRAENELSRELLQRNDPVGAAILLRLATEIEPDRPGAWYNLARAYALSGRPQDTVQALCRAVDLGFSDAEQMAADPDLEAVRADTTYVRLLHSIQGN